MFNCIGRRQVQKMRLPKDIVGLILAFTSMLEQLQLGRSVCREWKGLVDRHPFLLRHIDLGDPMRFPVNQLDFILGLAGCRVKWLRICVRNDSHINKLPSLVPFEFHECVGKVVANLESLILVGHVCGVRKKMMEAGSNVESLLTLLKSSNSSTVNLTLESCGCSLNLLDTAITEANGRDGATLTLSSPQGRFFGDFLAPFECSRCSQLVTWARFCYKCNRMRCCSECSFRYWEWAGEHHALSTCECDDCRFRAKRRLTPIYPLLWSCRFIAIGPIKNSSFVRYRVYGKYFCIFPFNVSSHRVSELFSCGCSYPSNVGLDGV